MPDQKRVYVARIDVDISTKFEDWIEKDLLQVERCKIDKVVLNDYSIDERTLMVDMRDTVQLEKKGDTWAANRMQANQEVDSLKMNDLLREVDELKIVGVRPKPQGITERLQALTVSREDMMSLQTRGYYLTRTGDMMSNEGELQVSTDEGIVYTLRFGEILYGTGEAISAGAEATSDQASGPGENRYLFVSAAFDESLVTAPPKPGEHRVRGQGGERSYRRGPDEPVALRGLQEMGREREEGAGNRGCPDEAVRSLVLRDLGLELRQDPPEPGGTGEAEGDLIYFAPIRMFEKIASSRDSSRSQFPSSTQCGLGW